MSDFAFLNHKTPAFQFYPNDWLGSKKVRLMKPSERGGYMQLLAFIWEDPDLSIEDDDEVLADLSDLGDEWHQGAGEKIRKCFIAHPLKQGFLTNKKLMNVRKEQYDFHNKKVEAGKAGGKKRWAKDTVNAEKQKAKPKNSSAKICYDSANSKPIAKNSSSSSTSTSSSNNKKSVADKPPAPSKECLDFWIGLYQERYGCDPEVAYPKDPTLVKQLVDRHGVDEVKAVMRRHIASEKLLSIGGLKTCWNDLQARKEIRAGPYQQVVSKLTSFQRNRSVVDEWFEKTSSGGPDESGTVQDDYQNLPKLRGAEPGP